ncbi:acyl-homoserine-lactone synthase [Neptunicoccus cionae]|uniref:Acyl-homoserine-lactone synthase n=1 Tax=Neptunicoccus cionae TaxID=2035344 RepID=A0A916QZI0_9RHOB|nr:acyl-homoserine-lactone synthase [Amylibacter cionae]GGA23699.1 acyl-homoserine-lactone synthase [Amylibacter cionae]
MLSYLYADEIAAFPLLQDTMFRDRKTQFVDRLGWDLTIDRRGWEQDDYDGMNPLYAIWQLPDGSHGGSMRVLPTTGPCMTNDHFCDVTGGAITSPVIWESTRFCLSPRVSDQAGRISAAIMLAGCEIGLGFHLRHAIGVFDARMVRIYRRLGWAPEIVGSQGQGRQQIAVGLWEFSQQIRDTLCVAADVSPAQSADWFAAAFGAKPINLAQEMPSQVSPRWS